MSDALSCDGPDCDRLAESPFLGWWQLENASIVSILGERDRLDFCSWQCLGAFVLDKAGDIRDLEQRINDL